MLANGAPAQPQFDGSGTLTSLTNVAAAERRQRHLQLRRLATRAPTSTRAAPIPQKQVRMGLFGALIVRPDDGRRLRRTTAPTASSRRPKSSWCCSRRSTRTSTRRPKRGTTVQPEQLPPALLADQRPRLPGLASPTTSRPGCPTSPTARWRASIPIRRRADTTRTRARSATSTSAPRTSRSTRTATTAW